MKFEGQWSCKASELEGATIEETNGNEEEAKDK